MYAVIFRARTADVDDEYARVAASLREMAMTSFGCLEFVSATENGQEIAISYWPSEASIVRWKAHADHLAAQWLGREKWYASYTVQVVEIRREYRFEE